MDFIRKFAGLLSFSTIVPIRSDASVEDIASLTLHWPLVGLFIGGVVGLSGLICSRVLPGPVAACLAYAVAVWFTGFHHLDGLIDMGDALMSHGTFERKVEIMRDPRIGTGGLGLLIIVSSTTIASIYSLPTDLILQGLLISEVGAKVGITGCALVSRPLDTGTGRYFILAARRGGALPVWLIWMVAGYLILGLPGAVSVVSAILAGVFIGLVARRNFYWSTGDVLGASNEFARMMSLLGLLAGVRLI